MSALLTGLEELEKKIREAEGAPTLRKMQLVPNLITLAFALLSLIVHQVQRQQILIEKLERKADGEN